MSAAFAGAVDLAGLKARATAPAAAAAPVPESEYVINLDEVTFGQVIQSSAQVLVVMELWSARAGADQLSVDLAELAADGQGTWLLARVDVDTQPRIVQALAQAMPIQGVPTVIAWAGGQPVDAFTGIQPKDALTSWVGSLIAALRDQLPGIKQAEEAAGVVAEPEPVDPRFVEAEELLDAGDFDGAKAAYQAILAVEPANAQAAQALGQVDFLARVTGQPADAVEQADADPDDVAKQCAAADAEVAAGQVEEAFNRLIGAVRRTVGDDRTAARDHLVSLFGLFPTDDPQVQKARRQLAAALY